MDVLCGLNILNTVRMGNAWWTGGVLLEVVIILFALAVNSGAVSAKVSLVCPKTDTAEIFTALFLIHYPLETRWQRPVWC